MRCRVVKANGDSPQCVSITSAEQHRLAVSLDGEPVGLLVPTANFPGFYWQCDKLRNLLMTHGPEMMTPIECARRLMGTDNLFFTEATR